MALTLTGVAATTVLNTSMLDQITARLAPPSDMSQNGRRVGGFRRLNRRRIGGDDGARTRDLRRDRPAF
jgi:hypothetical protein